MSFHRIPITPAEREEELRTDTAFRTRFQADHHQAFRSILENLPIDMIMGFPSSDSLHLLDLGIIKRLFLIQLKNICLYKINMNAESIFILTDLYYDG